MDQNEKTLAAISQPHLNEAPKPVEIISAEYIDDIRRVALPPGWTLEERDDINIRTYPRRKEGRVTLTDAESFIDYISRHKIPDSTTVYCQVDYKKGDVNLCAVLNDHLGQHDGQQWRDHLAIFSPVESVEWQRWTGSDTKQFNQVEFALFLEENLRDIATVEGMPTGQQLLEMALSFEANQDMRFKSAMRLQNGGVQMSFVQDDDSQTLAKMQMFDKIALGIPLFWNGAAYRLDARLRYRVRDGKLIFWYELIRPDKVIEDAVKVLIEHIKEKTQVFFYFGDPVLNK